MPKYLVIVESPAKSKTIEKYLGENYNVASSKGHVRDLTTRGYGGFGIDVEDHFKPMYKILKDKSSIVKELKKEALKAEKVFLATDPDREGEAISWHLYELLGLSNKSYERIVFHEITKSAVLKAFENGREIDTNLVKSQESRRILDRIIGFSLSKLLQRKIGSKSAGRVQSVALKLIVDKEREIEAFIPEEYWNIFLEHQKRNKKVKFKLVEFNGEKVHINNKEEADNVLNSLTDDYIVDSIDVREREKGAKAPFITSTLQQEASNKFSFNSKKTMMIAQKLYEGIELKSERVGLITYMRTDSLRLSDEFVNETKEYVQTEYGNSYYDGYKEFSKKGKNVQDAHEAIRPSKIKYHPDSIKEFLTNDEFKLYSLIYYRAMASLMKNAIIEETKVKVENNKYIFETNGERVVFDGYLKVYGQYENDVEKELPKYEIGDKLIDSKITSEQKFTNPPARYTEARIIKKMEELGIGRPSTYSTTVDTLKQRNYVKLENKAFIPTKQGILTSDSLDKYFNDIINVKYTAKMEETLDDISEGTKIWYEKLAEFYEQFMPLIEFADTHMEKSYPVVLDENCPNCGSPLVMRNGRYGEFAACSAFPKCRYIKSENKVETVTTDVKCPNCDEGYLVERFCKRGKKQGQKFFACNRYPKCKTTFSELPEVH